MSSSTQATNPSNNATSTNAPQQQLTPLEQEVLDEYARLLGNMNNLSSSLAALTLPPAEVLEDLRTLERKTGLVFTLLKASVYSIVLQQEVSYGAGPTSQSQGQSQRSQGGGNFGYGGGSRAHGNGYAEDGGDGEGSEG